MKLLLPVLSVLAVLGSALAARAQTAPSAAATTTTPAFTLECRDYNGGGRQTRRACELRELRLDAPAAGQPLTVDAAPNGGITVHGWDGPDVRVRARVESRAPTEAEARTRLQAIQISSANGTLRTSAPDRPDNWSVSYEVFVPRTTALALSTTNGGISLDNLLGAIDFKTVNGGISLARLGGQVRGRTTNGGVDIALSGPRWEGEGLDVETTNGGINWELPRTYSAQLFTSTDVGGITSELPLTQKGLLRRELTATLGQGGASLRAVTTNGGVSVRQAGQ